MVKVGIQLPHDPMELIIQAGKFADKNGFDSVFTPDHIVGIGIKNFQSFEAFTVLGFLSGITENVLLGTCVSDVLRKHPAVLLQSAITLDYLSGGRFILGLGAGEGMNTIPFGIDMRNAVSKLEEGLKVIRLLMEKDRVNFEGRFFKLKNAFISPRKKIPIWIAGNSERTTELTAKYGDGWIPTASIGVEGYRENLKKIRKNAGRRIEAGLFAYIVIAEDYDTARERIELPGKMLALISPRRNEFLKKIGIEVDFPDLIKFEFNRENVRKVLEKAKELPFDLVEERYIYGDPDSVIGKMERFAKAGVEHFVLTPLVQEKYYMENLKLLAEKVIPHLS